MGDINHYEAFGNIDMQESYLNISLAASMHDTGKIAIDDSILNKLGRLLEEELCKINNQ